MQQYAEEKLWRSPFAAELQLCRSLWNAAMRAVARLQLQSLVSLHKQSAQPSN